jgi:hypothetical protein
MADFRLDMMQEKISPQDPSTAFIFRRRRFLFARLQVMRSLQEKILTEKMLLRAFSIVRLLFIAEVPSLNSAV